MVLIAVSFVLCKILQVILVTLPMKRYLNGAGVFFPAVGVIALFIAAGRIRLWFRPRTVA
jgi:hypothetical protein